CCTRDLGWQSFSWPLCRESASLHSVVIQCGQSAQAAMSDDEADGADERQNRQHKHSGAPGEDDESARFCHSIDCAVDFAAAKAEPNGLVDRFEEIAAVAGGREKLVMERGAKGCHLFVGHIGIRECRCGVADAKANAAAAADEDALIEH